MSKLKKSLLISGIVLVILVGGVILFISPITKYLIQKYDEKYTGRQITIDWAYTNPFTGFIHLSNLKIYENNSDTIFFSAKEVNANFSMLKMFSQTYEINKITINEPRGIVIQNKLKFNFEDLIEKFTTDSNSVNAPVHFNILDINIKDGEFYYIDKVTPISYFIKQVNIQSTGKRWNLDTLVANFSFTPGIGNGDIKGDFGMNVNTKDYSLTVIANKYDLNFIGQYLKDITNYGSFSANLDAHMNVIGNFNNGKNITAKGMVAFNDFHFGKTPDNDYAYFENLAISINELSPLKQMYFYDSIILNRPYFKYERYDSLDNLQTMFGKNGNNIENTIANNTKFNLVIEIANYIKLISQNFLQSHYKVDKLAIYNSDIKFNDYSLNEKFTIELNPLTIIADSIDTNNKRVNVSVKSGIKPYGDFSGTLSINPKDSSDFDLHYNLQNLPVAMFNPYTIEYTSFPLDRGTIGFNGTWHVRDGVINSENHLLITDPRTSSRIKNKSVKYIPMPLVMAFVRDGNNVIDYEIPITGNLKNPKFNLRDVFLNLLENIFVKPPTTPYRMKVNSIETEIEESFVLTWNTRQSFLFSDQNKFIEKLAEFLKKNPEENIVVHPHHFELKEKEYILFYEAKKKYFLTFNNKTSKTFNELDSIKVEKMSVKDAQFIHYLNTQVKDSLLFTVQEKCIRLLDASFLNSKYKQLNKQREEDFLSCFKKEEVRNQVKFSSEQRVVPYNGFSFYKIEYKSEFPESLIKAYQKMNEINDKAERKKELPVFKL
ncbi:MAG: DUF748 domain-containing protein [Bacteroidetes bacterium]|nr:DUF748 domain-containing protein [Bacteroidota bacterium]HET6245095.1 DUF748 domain-containing protein [Bacteroidia bacterium]